MGPGLVSAWIVFLRIAVVSSQQECTYKCDWLDACRKSRFYDVVNGSCARNSEPTTYRDYMLGAVSCHSAVHPHKIIHDAATCNRLQDAWKGRTTISYLDESNLKAWVGSWDRGFLLNKVFNPEFEWDPESDYGCSISSSAPAWMGLPEARTQVCVASEQNWFKLLAPILGGLVIGFCLAYVTHYFSDGHAAFDESSRFELGTKLLVAKYKVGGYGHRRFVFWFRVAQVLANAWFPMVVALFVTYTIFIPCYFILYVIPAFDAAGWEVFRQPIYLITPPDCSLFGIDQRQDHHKILKRRAYLLSAIRPMILLIIVCSIAIIVKVQGWDAMFWNTSGFFRIALIHPPGPLVLDFVLLGSGIGVVAHMFMTLHVLSRSSIDDKVKQPITGVMVYGKLIDDDDKLPRFSEDAALNYVDDLYSQLEEQPEVQCLIDMDKTKDHLEYVFTIAKKNKKEHLCSISFIVDSEVEHCETLQHALGDILRRQEYYGPDGEHLHCKLYSPPIISFDKNDMLTQSIQEDCKILNQKLSVLVSEWDASDGLESEREERDNAFECIDGMQESALGLATMLFLAAVDFVIYFWKIYVFVQGSSYFLAIIIMAALSEALFTLWFTGSCNACAAAKMSFRSRVQTRNFIALVRWDDGLAGVPYLMITTIYALPLQDLSNWVLTASAFIFIITGTRAMATFIVDAVDYDMLDADGGGSFGLLHESESESE